jgi:hypothetical protein
VSKSCSLQAQVSLQHQYQLFPLQILFCW